MRIMPTQAETLIGLIRQRGKRGLTYLDLNLSGVSVSGWRRLSPDEKPERYLRPGEKLTRGKDCEGRTTFVIVRQA